MPYYLITSRETGKTYKRKKLKKEYKNIQQGSIKRVYEVKRSIGYISQGKVYKNN